MSILSRTFEHPEDMIEAYDKTTGFSQEIQKQILRASEGDISRVDELVQQAQEGAFDTKMCKGLEGELMCEYIPQELGATVIKLVEEWRGTRTQSAGVRQIARNLKTR